MGITIGQPPVVPGAPWVNTPLVYIKQDFGDGWTFTQQQAQFGLRFGKDWTLAPDLEFITAHCHSSAQDLERAEFQRQYGRTKHPFQPAIASTTPWDLRGWWVCIMFGEFLQATRRRGTSSPHWLGRIYDAPSRVDAPESPGESGLQKWVAYGPKQELRLAQMFHSYWGPATPPAYIQWVPIMNGRDTYTLNTGNRTSARGPDGVYLYGGTERWSHYDYAEYMLYYFMGPNWYLGGQADLLKSMSSVIDFGQNPTVDEVLRKLIPVEAGLDYRVRWRNAGAQPGETWNAGWEVFVYSLQVEPVSFGSVTLPANEDKITINLAQNRDVDQCQIVPSDDHLYQRLAVFGRRVVVCCTLRQSTNSLWPAWTSAAMAYYKNPPVNPEQADWSDWHRRKDWLRDVYRKFTAPPGWDMLGGDAAPFVGWDGHVDTTQIGYYQNLVRSTLSWLPLNADTDYSVWPPVYSGPADVEPEKLSPLVFLYDPPGFPAPRRGYFLADQQDPGFGVQVLKHEWGVFIQANPNHLLAANRWAGANATNTDPVFDYGDSVFTIAFEADTRAQLVHETVKNATGPWKILEEPDAELWWLAPNTAVGVDGDANLVTSGATGRELRNDIPLLERAMAGAIARYTRRRWRCQLTFNGLYPWDHLVGKVLTIDDGFGNTTQMSGPITSVQWVSGERPSTIIKAGFAQ